MTGYFFRNPKGQLKRSTRLTVRHDGSWTRLGDYVFRFRDWRRGRLYRREQRLIERAKA